MPAEVTISGDRNFLLLRSSSHIRMEDNSLGWNYHVYNLSSRLEYKLQKGGKTSFTLYCLYSWPHWVPAELGSVQAAVWSSVGSAMAMVRDNNIYYRETMDHTLEKITTTGEVGSLYNGVPDWLYGGIYLE